MLHYVSLLFHHQVVSYIESKKYKYILEPLTLVGLINILY